MQLSLGFSTCPNDTFMFDAMIHQKIDTGKLTFDVTMADIAELNQFASEKKLDIVKVSYNAFASLTSEYKLLTAGSALGRGCGPLLIAKEPLSAAEINAGVIAIPGEKTTANFLFSMAYPHATNKKEILFSAIENQVLEGNVTAGVIIHENRFTYASKGLVKIMDLGEFWETTTNLPIPLGGIAIKRDLPLEIQQQVNQLLSESIRFAFTYPNEVMSFVRKHAQEMDNTVMLQHIDLYVNTYSVDLGKEGKSAVTYFLDQAGEMSSPEDIFVNYPT